MNKSIETQLPLPSRHGIRSKEIRVCDNRMMQAIIKDITHLTVNQAQSLSEESLSTDSLSIAQVYQEMGFDGQELLDFIKYATQEAMKVTQNQLAYAQKGIAALTVDSRIDSDPTTWDMNHMALLGYYLEKNFKDVDDEVYEFNLSTATWSRLSDGKDFDLHPESGEPVVFYGSNEVIAGVFI